MQRRKSDTQTHPERHTPLRDKSNTEPASPLRAPPSPIHQAVERWIHASSERGRARDIVPGRSKSVRTAHALSSCVATSSVRLAEPSFAINAVEPSVCGIRRFQ